MLTAELNRTRRIGCEYEMTVPLVGTGSGRDIQEVLARVLTANGVRAISRGYDHSLLPPGVDVAVEYDNSVQGESRWEGVHWFPIELKTRILNGIDEWESLVPKTLEICRYMGARVNPSTGHHIHLSFDEVNQTPRTVRSLWNVFHRFNDVIFGLVAPSRRNNNYCRPMPPNAAGFLHGVNSVRNLKIKLAMQDRRQALNLTHLFEDAPHLELRHHQGTLNITTARMWLRLCLQLVQHSVNRNCQAADAPTSNDRRGIESLLTVCGFKVNTKVYSKVSPELRECGRFMLKRWKGFQGNFSLRQDKADREAQAAEVD